MTMRITPLLRRLVFVLVLSAILIAPAAAQSSTFELFINAIAWSPDGKLIAFAGGQTACLEPADPINAVYLLNPETKTISYILVGSRCYATSLDWNSTGTQLGVSGDTIARIWDIETQTLITKSVPTSHGYSDIRWSPDDKLLATLGIAEMDFAFVVWSALTGE
ncbi:MAG: WD40 repeat domain-containing protein, partial [Armatimonadetes bacterium]|nr:WD40 repeat domain-containing protein [Anaerolineae bacterium]